MADLEGFKLCNDCPGIGDLKRQFNMLEKKVDAHMEEIKSLIHLNTVVRTTGKVFNFAGKSFTFAGKSLLYLGSIGFALTALIELWQVAHGSNPQLPFHHF